MAYKRPPFYGNFYVEFYYKKGSPLEQHAGRGPHYAGFNTREEAELHIENCFTGDWLKDTEAEKITIRTGEELNEQYQTK